MIAKVIDRRTGALNRYWLFEKDGVVYEKRIPTIRTRLPKIGSKYGIPPHSRIVKQVIENGRIFTKDEV